MIKKYLVHDKRMVYGSYYTREEALKVAKGLNAIVEEIEILPWEDY
jgi:hypothetical protein